MRRRGRPPHPDILTPREWEVLALLREGLSNPEIAVRLGIGREGVKSHVSEILGKLSVSSREEAARWAPSERPWWAGAVAPMAWLWRKAHVPWLATGAAGIAAVLVVVSVALLVWGLVRTDGDGVDSASVTVGTACPGDATLPSSESPLFTYAAPDNTIWVMRADGTNSTQLICNSTGPRNASWSPSGNYLAYVDSDGSLRMLNVETGENAVVDDGSQGSLLYGSAPSQAAFFGWSPSTETLLYDKYGNADLRTSLGRWVVKPGGSPIALNLNSSARDVTLSPDGLRLVYYVPTYIPPPEFVRSGEIFLVNIDGTGYRKLADGIFPSWSPDGHLLAYWTEDRGGSSFIGDIVIMEVATGRSVSLGQFTSDESPAWSPDTTRSVFHNMEIDMEAETATPLFDRPGTILGWSPDGTKVAYVEGRAFGPPPRTLFVRDLRSDQASALHTSNVHTAHALGSGYRGVWSPDGRYYAYSAVESTDAAGVVVLQVRDTESGATNRLWKGTVLDWVSLSYSPDSSNLLVDIRIEQAHTIWMAEPDGSGFTKVIEGEALLSSTRRPAWLPAGP